IYNQTVHAGINFDNYEKIDVEVSGVDRPGYLQSFDEIGLSPVLMDNISKKFKYTKLTPVQRYAIPIVLKGRDLMACAQTGSGKTAAFILPMAKLITEIGDISTGGGYTTYPVALVLVPTRELCNQTFEFGLGFLAGTGVRIQRIYGGPKTDYLRNELANGCHILVATPGRLKDFAERNIVSLNKTRFLVLDEADQMLDRGFMDSVTWTLDQMPSNRQILMFSATFPGPIQALAQQYLQNYLYLTVGQVGAANPDVTQEVREVQQDDKQAALESVIDEWHSDPARKSDRILIFVETKRQADFVGLALTQKKQLLCTTIHGDRLQSERETAIRDFKRGKKPVMVATNVSARGVDINGIELVINMDLPSDFQMYVHRIGRTGRCGNPGKSISFYDHGRDSALALLLRQNLEKSGQSVPDWLDVYADQSGGGDMGGVGGFVGGSNRDMRRGVARDRFREQPDEGDFAESAFLAAVGLVEVAVALAAVRKMETEEVLKVVVVSVAGAVALEAGMKTLRTMIASEAVAALEPPLMMALKVAEVASAAAVVVASAVAEEAEVALEPPMMMALMVAEVASAAAVVALAVAVVALAVVEEAEAVLEPPLMMARMVAEVASAAAVVASAAVEEAEVASEPPLMMALMVAEVASAAAVVAEVASAAAVVALAAAEEAEVALEPPLMMARMVAEVASAAAVVALAAAEEAELDEIYSRTVHTGINFDKYEQINVEVSGTDKPGYLTSFDAIGLPSVMLDNILRKYNYNKLTPVQKYGIPIILKGRDLMACAQTGSGKTAAFLLPLAKMIAELDTNDSTVAQYTTYPVALILTPTRELCNQIYDFARGFLAGTNIHAKRVYGGPKTDYLRAELANGCHILVATPGRLKDFAERNIVSLNKTRFLVLDEADQMLDRGFLDSVTWTLEQMPSDRQIVMFSATFPNQIQALAQQYLQNYLYLTVGQVGAANPDVTQEVREVQQDDKQAALESVIDEWHSDPARKSDRILIFVETKRQADFVGLALTQKKQLPCTTIHGDRQQRERETAIRDFKRGKNPIMVATNVSARGVDINGIELVINMDLPSEFDMYVHRIGRTGRCGNTGKSISFYDHGRDSALAQSCCARIWRSAPAGPAAEEESVPRLARRGGGGFGSRGDGGFGSRRGGRGGFGASDDDGADGGGGGFGSRGDGGFGSVEEAVAASEPPMMMALMVAEVASAAAVMADSAVVEEAEAVAASEPMLMMALKVAEVASAAAVVVVASAAAVVVVASAAAVVVASAVVEEVEVALEPSLMMALMVVEVASAVAVVALAAAEEAVAASEPPLMMALKVAELDEIYSRTVHTGINFDKYEQINVEVSGTDKPGYLTSFDAIGLPSVMLDNILRKYNYNKLTPVQKYGIPIILKGRDLMACAQTGSGKTAAFLLPLAKMIAELDTNDSTVAQYTTYPVALILTPTRELCNQIYDFARGFLAGTNIRVKRVYGGPKTDYLRAELANGCHILVATPGRLKDFAERNIVSLSKTRFLVLDEADQMLDRGFLDSVTWTLEQMPSDRQIVMFSATFPGPIQALAQQYLQNYLYLTVGQVGAANPDVTQEVREVQQDDKQAALIEILKHWRSDPSQADDRILIFVESKRKADYVGLMLSDGGFPCTTIHGDRLQREREISLRSFQRGRLPIMVATNVSARGVDINGIELVINMDLPNDFDMYVHRIGRTGRCGNPGKSISFYDHRRDSALASSCARIWRSPSVPDWLDVYADQSGGGGFVGGNRDMRRGVARDRFREQPDEGDFAERMFRANPVATQPVIADDWD
uniref:RNA helicase n=1 Tax=Macrostomum lignano TaxID=282301 RepID=A0A1I8HWZ9_9PLAT